MGPAKLSSAARSRILRIKAVAGVATASLSFDIQMRYRASVLERIKQRKILHFETPAVSR